MASDLRKRSRGRFRVRAMGIVVDQPLPRDVDNDHGVFCRRSLVSAHAEVRIRDRVTAPASQL